MDEIVFAFLGGLVIGLSIGAIALYKVWRAGMKKLEKGEADE